MNEDKLKFLLGCRIRELRIYKSLTQEQLCEKVKIEQPTLSNIENGKNFPLFPTFLAIIQVLEAEPNEVLDFLNGFDDVDLSSDINKQIFKQIADLPQITKQVIYEMIKNKK